jgi:hypothetical protein
VDGLKDGTFERDQRDVTWSRKSCRRMIMLTGLLNSLTCILNLSVSHSLSCRKKLCKTLHARGERVAKSSMRLFCMTRAWSCNLLYTIVRRYSRRFQCCKCIKLSKITKQQQKHIFPVPSQIANNQTLTMTYILEHTDRQIVLLWTMTLGKLSF